MTLFSASHKAVLMPHHNRPRMRKRMMTPTRMSHKAMVILQRTLF